MKVLTPGQSYKSANGNSLVLAVIANGVPSMPGWTPGEVVKALNDNLYHIRRSVGGMDNFPNAEDALSEARAYVHLLEEAMGITHDPMIGAENEIPLFEGFVIQVILDDNTRMFLGVVDGVCEFKDDFTEAAMFDSLPEALGINLDGLDLELIRSGEIVRVIKEGEDGAWEEDQRVEFPFPALPAGPVSDEPPETVAGSSGENTEKPAGETDVDDRAIHGGGE